MRMDIFGYFDNESDSTPTHDPGPDGLCPVCCHSVGRHSVDNLLKTISLAVYDKKFRNRSFFVRAHKNCWERISEAEQNSIESSVIDEHISNNIFS